MTTEVLNTVCTFKGVHSALESEVTNTGNVESELLHYGPHGSGGIHLF